jgi:hypothetical protein
MRQTLRVGAYRFRATFARRWAGYAAIALLVALTGGVSMASVAAARRTQASYPTLLASTNPSDMNVTVYEATTGTAVASLTSQLAGLPQVRRVGSALVPHAVPLTRAGAPRLGVLGTINLVGSTDGEFTAQDRLAFTQGRAADPHRVDQVTLDASAARQLGVHVGQRLPIGLYTDAQTSLPGFGTAAVPPRLRVAAMVTGIAVDNNSVVQDDVDRAYGLVYATPALTREAVALDPKDAAPEFYALQLRHGAGDVPAVEQEIARLVPPDSTAEFHVTARVVTQVELAVRPESLALAGFGAIAGVVCLILGAQAIGRQLRAGGDDGRVLRALGAGSAVAASDGLIGILGAVVVGSVLAVAVAVGLSPLSPLGPVRPVTPFKGVAWDWTVLGAGLGTLGIGLGAVAVGLGVRAARREAAGRRAPARTSGVARAMASAGLPVVGVVGVRFALETGSGPRSVPVRSVLVGTVVAVALVMASLTFAASLQTLVSEPPLYGWNWTYALTPTNDVPPQSLALLRRDPLVAGWTGVDYNNVDIDGQTVPVLMARSLDEPVAPPVLSGHALAGDHQIVLGAATLALLHKHLGQTVTVSYGTKARAPVYVPPTRLTIVGTATFPAVGYESVIADHTSMGIGALFSEEIFPGPFRQVLRSPDANLNGPELVFVRMRPGVSPAAGRADMQRIAQVGNRVFAADPGAASNDIVVLGVQRPAQIVNYRSIGSTPLILAAALGAGAVAGLALTLMASVRRRWRELALLKSLGLGPRQLGWTIVWQATVAAVTGVVLGLPLGIVLGRQLWTLFARSLDAVPSPTVPALTVVLVGLGTLLFADLVAALPGARAARVSATSLLRAE